MKRIIIKDGLPPLAQFLQPRPTKLTKMKNRVTSLANTILGFFSQYMINKRNKNTNGGDIDNANNNSQQTLLESAPNLTSKQAKLLKKAATKRAARFISYHDVSSQSEDEAEEIPGIVVATCEEEGKAREPVYEELSEDTQRCGYGGGYGDGKKKIVIYGQKIKEAEINDRINKIKDKIRSRKLQKKQSLEYSDSDSNPDPTNPTPTQNPTRKRKTNRNNLPKDSTYNPLSKYEVESKDGPYPRKRMCVEQRYLGYLEGLSKKKVEIYRQVQEKMPRLMAQYTKNSQLQGEINQEYQEYQSNGQNLEYLQKKLQKFQENKAQINKIDKNSQFSCSDTVIKPKKIDLSIDKMLQIVREKKQVAIGQFKPVAEDQEGQIEGDEHQEIVVGKAKTDKMPSLFGNLTGTTFNPGFSLFNTKKPENNDENKVITSVDANKQIDKVVPKLFQNADKQKSISNITGATTPNIGTLFASLKPATDNQNPQKKPQAAEPSSKTPAEQPNKQPISTITEKQPSEPSELTTKSAPPLTENPFLKKPGAVARDLLPELIGSFSSNPLFGNKTSTTSSLFGNLVTPTPVVVPATPKKQEQKNQFSTPTKNILQKYPQPVPVPNNAPSQPIPQSQQQQSSMYDESQHSVSRREVASVPEPLSSPFRNHSQSGLSIFSGGASWMQNPLVDGGPNAFLSTVPSIDIQKSLALFGKPPPSENLWDTSAEKKKTDNKVVNKKKSKEQRVYG